MPLFAGMAGTAHGEANKSCSRATLGDAVIMLVAYGFVALVARNRRWILAPALSQLALFVAIGVVVTAVIEWLVLHGRWIDSWSYARGMPIVPGLGIGLVPLLQWIVLPLLVVWFVRRQLAMAGGTNDDHA